MPGAMFIPRAPGAQASKRPLGAEAIVNVMSQALRTGASISLANQQMELAVQDDQRRSQAHEAAMNTSTKRLAQLQQLIDQQSKLGPQELRIEKARAGYWETRGEQQSLLTPALKAQALGQKQAAERVTEDDKALDRLYVQQRELEEEKAKTELTGTRATRKGVVDQANFEALMEATGVNTVMVKNTLDLQRASLQNENTASIIKDRTVRREREAKQMREGKIVSYSTAIIKAAQADNTPMAKHWAQQLQAEYPDVKVPDIELIAAMAPGARDKLVGDFLLENAPTIAMAVYLNKQGLEGNALLHVRRVTDEGKEYYEMIPEVQRAVKFMEENSGLFDPVQRVKRQRVQALGSAQKVAMEALGHTGYGLPRALTHPSKAPTAPKPKVPQKSTRELDAIDQNFRLEIDKMSTELVKESRSIETRAPAHPTAQDFSLRSGSPELVHINRKQAYLKMARQAYGSPHQMELIKDFLNTGSPSQEFRNLLSKVWGPGYNKEDSPDTPQLKGEFATVWIRLIERFKEISGMELFGEDTPRVLRNARRILKGWSPRKKAKAKAPRIQRHRLRGLIPGIEGYE